MPRQAALQHLGDALNRAVAWVGTAVACGVGPQRPADALVFPTCVDAPLPVAAGEPPTWSEDAAPIIYEHCASCHQPGGSAPFSLLTLDEVRAWDLAVRSAVVERRMPPAGPTSCGACQSFRNARWLDAADIATLAAFVDADLPAGPGGGLPDVPPAIVPLARVDVTLTAPEPYLPEGNGADDYRCFVVEPTWAEDRFLTGFAVAPDRVDQVHHVILYATHTQEQADEAHALDEQEEGSGYTCFGGAGVDGGQMVGIWAPGGTPKAYPDGTGVRVSATAPLIMQVHYNLLGGAASDQSEVQLTLEDAVAQEATIVNLSHPDFALEPGQAEVSSALARWRLAPGAGALRIHGIAPHMHTMGRGLQVEVWNDQSYTCLVDVPSWDFSWQDLYFYDEPVDVAGSDRVAITCTWDTRGADDTVTWGDGTADEMCLALVYVTDIPRETAAEE